MSHKSATALANDLLAGGPGGLEDLRIHQFPDDQAAHDDEKIKRLYIEFSADFDHAQEEISKKYGAPSRTGKAGDDAIPLCGVFRFAIWDIDEQQLFIAAAHEDRGVPILLMLGTA